MKLLQLQEEKETGEINLLLRHYFHAKKGQMILIYNLKDEHKKNKLNQ